MATYRPKPKDETVEALELVRRTELLTDGVDGGSEVGEAGDYLVARDDGIHIMSKAEFEATYVPVTNALTHWDIQRTYAINGQNVNPSRILPYEEPSTYTMKVE
jgi:hypothetical protein